jgi:hypothetical protein
VFTVIVVFAGGELLRDKACDGEWRGDVHSPSGGVLAAQRTVPLHVRHLRGKRAALHRLAIARVCSRWCALSAN